VGITLPALPKPAYLPISPNAFYWREAVVLYSMWIAHLFQTDQLNYYLLMSSAYREQHGLVEY